MPGKVQGTGYSANFNFPPSRESSRSRNLRCIGLLGQASAEPLIAMNLLRVHSVSGKGGPGPFRPSARFAHELLAHTERIIGQ